MLGGPCYAAAFLFAERHAGHAPNFYFYGTAAGVLTLVGTAASLAGTPLVLAGCALARSIAAIVPATVGPPGAGWTLAWVLMPVSLGVYAVVASGDARFRRRGGIACRSFSRSSS